MTRTAAALSAEEQRSYRLDAQVDKEVVAERWEHAWQVARRAAELLRERFGATRVMAFGSLAHRAWFTPWSDIDLAAWGIPPDAFYQAVALVAGLSPEFEIDLVELEGCRPALRRVIEREGVEL
jgi:predicted nucleotidyltransferase